MKLIYEKKILPDYDILDEITRNMINGIRDSFN